MEVFWEYARAFLCGGALCLIGQLLIDKTKLTPARILVLYVVSGVVLGGLGLYKYVVEFGGAGATVPLTGFGYLLAKGAVQAVRRSTLEQQMRPAITAAAASRRAAGGAHAAYLFQALRHLRRHIRPRLLKYAGHRCP